MISRFPHGFAAGVLIRERLINQAMARTNLYVGNNSTLLRGEKGASDSNNAGTYLAPYSTVDYAIGQSKEGDIIWIRPNYTETITADADWTCDIAGVTIVGLGTGASRPTITINSAADDGSGSILISADSVAISNIIVVCAEDGSNNPFQIQAADCILDVETQDTSATVEADYWFVGTDAADRLTINTVHEGFTGGSGTTSYILLDGSTGAEIDCNFYGLVGTAVVEFNDTAVVDVNVRGTFYTSGTTDASLIVVDTATGSTWSAHGFDACAAAGFSGGSTLSGCAIDDVSSIGTQVSTALSEIGSNYAKVSAGVSGGTSEVGSVGTQVSTALSEIGSNYAKVSAGVSGGTSEVGSVGTQVSTALSEIGSNYAKVSAGVSGGTSEVGSVGTQVSTALSEIGSNYAKVSAGVSGGTSEVGSVGTQVSTALSEIGSNYAKLSAGISGGTSEIHSLYTFLSDKLSVIDNQVS